MTKLMFLTFMLTFNVFGQKPKIDTTTIAPKETPKSISTPAASKSNPIVVMQTTAGAIELELFKDKAPIAVANFLSYVDKGHYNGTIFHRVINNFMIQAGGLDKNMVEKAVGKPITNEANNGLSNEVGTLAMARMQAPNSATAQFFINVSDESPTFIVEYIKLPKQKQKSAMRIVSVA